MKLIGVATIFIVLGGMMLFLNETPGKWTFLGGFIVLATVTGRCLISLRMSQGAKMQFTGGNDN